MAGTSPAMTAEGLARQVINTVGRHGTSLSHLLDVITGLVPVISIGRALRLK